MYVIFGTYFLGQLFLRVAGVRVLGTPSGMTGKYVSTVRPDMANAYRHPEQREGHYGPQPSMPTSNAGETPSLLSDLALGEQSQ